MRIPRAFDFGLWQASLFAGLIFVFAPHAPALGQSHPPTYVSPWGGQVGGVVVDESNQPVKDAWVTVTSRDRHSGKIFQTKTDVNGRFEIKQPLVGFQSEIDIAHPGFVFFQDQIINDHQAIVLCKGKTITGRIVDASGQGIADVSVSPFAFQRSTVRRKQSWVTRTDDQGRFSIEHATTEDTQQLHIKKPGVVDQLLEWSVLSVPLPAASNPMHRIADFVRGDFTYVVKGRCRLNLEVVDSTGNQILPARVGCAKLLRVSRPLSSVPYLLEGNPESDTPFTHLAPEFYRIFAFPRKSSSLMGGFVDVKVTKESRNIEARIVLRPGKSFSGNVVDSKTGEAIQNAAISFVADNKQILETLKAVPTFRTLTNQSGEFSILVPEANGMLRLDRKVDGYVTLPNWEDATDEALKPFTLKISAQAFPSGIVFELDPAPIVEFQVYRANGNPAAGVSFLGTGAQRNQVYAAETGLSDQNGRFKLQSLFDDLLYDYTRPNEAAAGLAWDGVPVSTNVFQSSVVCWDPKTHECARIQVVPKDIVPGKPIPIHLKPGRRVTGRFVDHISGEPVTGTEVVVRGSYSMRWTTMTNNVGEFVVDGLLPEFNHRLVYYQTNVQFENRGIQFEGSRGTMDLGDIKVIDPNSYSREFVVPGVADLKAETAIEKLVKFADKATSKAPKTGGFSFPSNRTQYQMRLARSMAKEVESVLKRITESGKGLSARIKLLKAIDYSAGKFNQDINRIDWLEDSVNFLVEHIDLPGAFEGFKHFHRDRYSWGSHAKKILDTSNTPEIRASAYVRMLNSVRIAYDCRDDRVSDEQFDLNLKKVEEFWRLGLDEFGDITLPVDNSTPPTLQSVRSSIEIHIGSTLTTATILRTEDEAVKEDRFENLKALCERMK